LWPLLPALIIRVVEAVSELNKRRVRLFIEAVWNEGRLELIDELVAADYTGCFSRPQLRVLGPAGVSELVSSRRQAYPGLYVKVEDQIAEDDRVVTRWQAATRVPGAHAAGASVECVRCCSGISIVRLLAGKQVDSHTECHFPRGRGR
jgi:SnoaL-like polyketide cyclase